MSKRRIQAQIEDLEADQLGQLEPEDRLPLFIEATAAGKEAQLEALRETAPVNTYTATDLAYVHRGQAALRFLAHAMYTLHTTYLHYELLCQHQQLQGVINCLSNDDPDETAREDAEERAEDLQWTVADLYTAYHAYQQFATDTLGVSFETWAALHPDGAFILTAVEDILDDAVWLELAEERLNDTRTDEVDPEAEEWTSLDESAKRRYESLASMWEEQLDDSPE